MQRGCYTGMCLLAVLRETAVTYMGGLPSGMCVLCTEGLSAAILWKDKHCYWRYFPHWPGNKTTGKQRTPPNGQHMWAKMKGKKWNRGISFFNRGSNHSPGKREIWFILWLPYVFEAFNHLIESSVGGKIITTAIFVKKWMAKSFCNSLKVLTSEEETPIEGSRNISQ